MCASDARAADPSADACLGFGAPAERERAAEPLGCLPLPVTLAPPTSSTLYRLLQSTQKQTHLVPGEGRDGFLYVSEASSPPSPPPPPLPD
jgi:hypothetical protein